MPITEIQPSDYPDALNAAIYSWWYFLTFLFPAAVYAIPAVKRWKHILWLAPIAFVAACAGYLAYWRSIDYALMAYCYRTGYFNTADTWYVFMPIFRGIPNALFATVTCTIIGWLISRRPERIALVDIDPRSGENAIQETAQSTNPYAPPRADRR